MRLKRGDTFSLSCLASEDVEGEPEPVPVNLTDVEVRSAVRRQSGAPVLDLTVTKADQVTAPGEYTISATAEETAGWSLGTLQCDVRYIFPTGEVETTETFDLLVISEVTA